MSDPAFSSDPGPASGRDAPGRSNGLAVAALVTGIIALVLSWIPGINLLSIVLGIAALITGFMALRAANEPGGTGRGMAIGGVVCGALGLLFAVLIWVGLVAFINDPEVQQELEQIEQEQDGG